MKDRVKKIHFIGIGGVGMCGIAEVLHRQGYHISGSDISYNQNIIHLEKIGIKVNIGHNPNNLDSVDVVVISSAIKKDNVEYQVANLMNIPIIPRALMLAELMRFKKGIAVAGTHGKTTTTSLIVSIFAQAKTDPTYIIGGKLSTIGSNAKLGKGDYLIAEADESDTSFLYLNPLYAIITNIDEDHMQSYDYEPEKLYQAFIDFAHRIPFYGKVILGIDSDNVKKIIPKINKPLVTYGITDDADVYASNICYFNTKIQFKVNFKRNNFASFNVTLNQIGIQNVQNALAAIVLSLECGIDINNILLALENFVGVDRRLQYHGKFSLLGSKGQYLLIEDYGHHPQEIKPTINALRQAYPENRLVVVFQPHRYSRTRDLFEEFVKVLQDMDILILNEVYAAGEEFIDSASSEALAEAIRSKGKINPIYIKEIKDVPNALYSILDNDDIVLVLGAGNINSLVDILKNNQST